MKPKVECNHCGYHDEEQEVRFSAVGSGGAWVCKACLLCNTTVHNPQGYVTVLGYQRYLEVGYL